MNFAHNYITNLATLKNALIQSCIKYPDGDDVIINIDVIEYEDGVVINTYYQGEDAEPMCKVECTDKGIYFYERKKLL